MKNCITIDVEDWFNNMFLDDVISIDDWDNLPSVVREGTDVVLKILKKNQSKATFFILGWIAARYPEICEKIISDGHEICTHGYYHKLVCKQSSEEFEKDLSDSIDVIKKYTGVQPKGYRAPVASIDKNSMWAFDIMHKYGVTYDSSIYPTKGLVLFGIDNVARSPYKITDSILEIPLSIYKTPAIDLPLSGGFYLRSYPFYLYKKFFEATNKKGYSNILYMHPWEFCSNFPRKIKNPLWQWTQIYNINSMPNKLEELLKRYEFTSMKEAFDIR